MNNILANDPPKPLGARQMLGLHLIPGASFDEYAGNDPIAGVSVFAG